MNKKQIALIIVQLVLTILVAWLEFVDKESVPTESGHLKYVLETVVAYRPWIALILIIIVVSLTFLGDYLYRPNRRAKEIRQTIMEAMLEELFENDKINVRITIFKDANYFQNIRIYLYCTWKKNGIWDKIRFFFTRISLLISSFVVVWERLGKAHPNSKTFFRFDSQSQEACQGIAGVVRQSESDVLVVDLPNLDKLDWNTFDQDDKSKAIHKKVRKYMKSTYIDGDFETLRRLNRISRHIYGNVLSNNIGDFKGVLVIDSFNEESPFDEKVLENIPYYLKIIATTL